MEPIYVSETAQPRPWLKLLVVFVFVGGLGAFFGLGGEQWLSLEALQSNRDQLLGYTATHYWLMVGIALAVYTASTAFSIPGGAVLSLAMGFLFGRWIGTVLILVAATLGATIVFIAARYLFADAARRRLSGGVGARIIGGFHDNAFHYLLFLRLVPVFPFFLVNLAPAFTPIPVRTYVIATAIGILPGSFVFANLGKSLGRIDSLNQLVSAETLLAFTLLGVFALAPVVIKKFRKVK